MPREYSVTLQIPRTKINPATGEVEEGIDVSFRDEATGANGTVFVPGVMPEPELAVALIRDYINRSRAIFASGEE
jgi:hypothetical protein